MSNAAVRIGERAAAARADDYLGPATVLEASGRDLEIELPDGAPAVAERALAQAYEAAPGDVLLVIGKAGRYYAIGVLHGAGRTVLAFQGDVAVRAVGGELSLSGDRGVSLEGPEVEIRAGKLRMIADAAVQKFTSMFQRVSALLSVRAGQAHTVVDDTSHTQARSASIVTEETVSINGKTVHLG